MRQAELAAADGHVATQVGALCYRIKDGTPQVLLVTSRGTRRWVIPKGWPMAGLSDPEAAAREAWEEAGVRGRVSLSVIGLYGYVKTGPDEGDRPCVVAVFPLKVKSVARSFPERRDRQRRWFSPAEAAGLVQEPELQQILARFDPSRP
jgi:8-oxo-dGTP pyrophosphatase MutT (NUDIX family)